MFSRQTRCPGPDNYIFFNAAHTREIKRPKKRFLPFSAIRERFNGGD